MMLRQQALAEKLPGRDRQARQHGHKGRQCAQQQRVKAGDMQIPLVRLPQNKSREIKQKRGDHHRNRKMRAAAVQVRPQFVQQVLYPFVASIDAIVSAASLADAPGWI